MPPYSDDHLDLMDEVVLAELHHLTALIDLSTRFVTDRIKQDPTTISVDDQTGAVLGALSDAARAAKAAVERLIIKKGGGPPHTP